jgi:hypothetical protein
MMAPTTPLRTPQQVLESYRLDTRPPIYVVGAFDRGVTVRSQQIRALNLAWALVETGKVRSGQKPRRVAIVGAGFAGLTLAGGLLKKHTAARIAIFEERDVLLPLQQGSDTRWLHPHIYEWPSEGSEASAAMLPVLNWTAARASDVVVQVLGDWRRAVKGFAPSPPTGCEPRLFCNVRHLRVSPTQPARNAVQLEWVGEERCVVDGTMDAGRGAGGSSEQFDLVILAVGFGLELANQVSYWRNETLGQPSLDQPRRTYLISGQGDGAMIDLFRIRISQFRQDRILDELFSGSGDLLATLKAAKHAFDAQDRKRRLFRTLEHMAAEPSAPGAQLLNVIQALRPRLRRDTDAILRLRRSSLEDLIDGRVSCISFQNALLAYLVYKCGGFVPSSEEEEPLRRRHAIADDSIVRRHGTERQQTISRILSEDLQKSLKNQLSDSGKGLKQATEVCWLGGYFGHRGTTQQAEAAPPEERIAWRKEYLPGPTSLLASAVCGSVAALLCALWPGHDRIRVTLHRALKVGQEELLQQACDYAGRALEKGEPTGGRAYPAQLATIGLAYRTGQVIRSRVNVTPAKLREAMEVLGLKKAAREMEKAVHFVLAIPIFHSNALESGRQVAGTLYIDSSTSGGWLDESDVVRVIALLEGALTAVADSGSPFNRIRDFPTAGLLRPGVDAGSWNGVVAEALETVAVPPPTISGAFWLNFDHTDLDAADPISATSLGSGAEQPNV